MSKSYFKQTGTHSFKRIDEANYPSEQIGPYTINTRMSVEELQKLYDSAMKGFREHEAHWFHDKSEYQAAYLAIQELLKNLGARTDRFESIKEFDDDSMKAYGDAVKTAYGNDPDHSMMDDDEANKLERIVGPLQTFYNRLVAELHLDNKGQEALRHEIISFIQDGL
jgi:hypothetical protein